MKVESRAIELFDRARNLTEVDVKRILAEQSAVGQLKSGTTAIKAMAAFGQRSSAALKQVLDEVANRINHRGLEWRQAMIAVDKALERHVALAFVTIEPALKLAGATDGSARLEVEKSLKTIANDLRRQAGEFDEGWTSPNPMKWQERHPIRYAIGLLVIGALSTKLVEFLIDLVGT